MYTRPDNKVRELVMIAIYLIADSFKTALKDEQSIISRCVVSQENYFEQMSQ